MTMQRAEKTKRIQFHCTIIVLLSIFDTAVYSVNFKWIKLYWGKMTWIKTGSLIHNSNSSIVSY